jgi:YHS domain-containing protein
MDAADSGARVTVESQTHCPVMGNEIDKDVFTDFRGVRIYFCCPPCIKKFETNPDEYISKLPSSLQDKLANAPVAEGRQ